MATSQFIKIAVPGPFPKGLDYCCPANIKLEQLIGSRVRVPLGRRHEVGLVIASTEAPSVTSDKLKAFQQHIDTKPLFDHTLLACLGWVADYYHEPIGDVIHTALPALLAKGEIFSTGKQIAYQLTALGRTEQNAVRAPKQRKLLALLDRAAQPLTANEITQAEISRAVIKTLVEKQWLEAVEIQQTPPVASNHNTAHLRLNAAQQTALDWFKLHHDRFAAGLLDGVTGSGKTEVYLQAIDYIIQQGKQALVLVPEISLTPQTLARFEGRFNVPVMSYHSGLTDKQRLATWYYAKSGDARIVIGTRSAVFIPFQNLGAIVIDEEHDLSFKQQAGVRYHARDVAIKRASLHNIPILLGSATPSLESLHNADLKKYRHLQLPERAGNAKPAKQFIIDMRKQPLNAGISKALLDQARLHLAAGQQVMLFLNRRGYSPVLLCHQCGWTAKHDACGRHYTIHRQPLSLHCHHCDVVKPLPAKCPDCGEKDFVPVGAGTERMEAYLQEIFPDKKIVRIDRDVTRRKGQLDAKLAEIHSGDADILIGTQMLAKGHHFPDVTMVGIIDIDAALFSHDFRALERMGQIILQVAGRAGRAEKQGEVYLQTHQPQHALLNCLLQKGYHTFSQQLLAERKEAGWPPFCHMATLLAEANQPQPIYELLIQIRNQLQQWQTQDVMYFGPIPSLLPRRGGYHRQLLMFQSPSRQQLHVVLDGLNGWLRQQKIGRRVKWRIDVDPQEF